MIISEPRTEAEYKYIDASHKYAAALFGAEFRRLFEANRPKHKETIILCIGTDRATGDSLGPITGTKLNNAGTRNLKLYGTLDEPVHARNLRQTIDLINSSHNYPFIVAVDAALGSTRHIGFVRVGKGPISPGQSMRKDLPQIGDIHVTGVVNMGGLLESLVLQTTKLSLVMRMSEVISEGIYKGLADYSY